MKYSGTAFEPAGPTFYHYGYNTRSEIVSAERYFGTNTNSLDNPVGLQDWSYSYDNIGNRTASARANAISEYAANFLNQYTERTVPGYADILGTAETNVTVTVNTQAVTRQDYYWHKRLDVDNVLTSAYEEIVTTGVYSPGGTNDDIVTSVTGHMFVAESPEGFTYDTDGNLLSDGRWNYTWDAENRLISMQTQAGLPSETPILHVEFEYDYMSRRVGKTVYEWNTASNDWQEVSVSVFLYDGWNVTRSVTLSNDGAQTNFFTWGLDLSGSLQGAGGVGGLLSAVLGTNSVCYTYDGNGNVSEILDVGAGTPSSRILAHYEYSPFGETIVATGDLAKDNPFRFSTKYTDDETTLVYYGYRFYNPGLGRWINRDPIGERGGLNLYVFVSNKQINNFDAFGLEEFSGKNNGGDDDGCARVRYPKHTSTIRRDIIRIISRLRVGNRYFKPGSDIITCQNFHIVAEIKMYEVHYDLVVIWCLCPPSRRREFEEAGEDLIYEGVDDWIEEDCDVAIS